MFLQKLFSYFKHVLVLIFSPIEISKLTNMGKGAGLLINAKKKTNTFSKIIKIGQNTEITIETNSIDEKTNKNLNRRYI